MCQIDVVHELDQCNELVCIGLEGGEDRGEMRDQIVGDTTRQLIGRFLVNAA